jgi:hypothetical protein
MFGRDEHPAKLKGKVGRVCEASRNEDSVTMAPVGLLECRDAGESTVYIQECERSGRSDPLLQAIHLHFTALADKGAERRDVEVIA